MLPINANTSRIHLSLLLSFTVCPCAVHVSLNNNYSVHSDICHPILYIFCLCFDNGFKLSASYRNKDINECLLRNGHGPCQDTCYNSFGSFACTCENLPGTRLMLDGRNCEDAGGCALHNGGCSHTCLTNIGRMFCLCPEGFLLGPDWKTCQGNVRHSKSK